MTRGFISIATEMVFSSNDDKMRKLYFKWDTDSHKSKDFVMIPIGILYIIVYTNKIGLNQKVLFRNISSSNDREVGINYI